MSVLLAVTSTVSALASGSTQLETAPQPIVTVAPVAAPTVEPTPTASTVVTVAPPAVNAHPRAAAVAVAPAKPGAKPAVAAKPMVVTRSASVTARPAATPNVTPSPKASAPPTPVAATRVVSATTITISAYVDAPGSQAAIDKCHLVLWSHHPLWLAGHNWCGFQWMAYVATGTTVHVTSGAAAGTFVVFGHLRLTRQGGVMPRTGADLVLQTCIGSGTGLTLLRRV